jgi:hypothetical protein
MIIAKLDVTLIDKTALFPGKKPNRAGKMPQYLDVILIPVQESKYGETHFCVQGIGKERKERGEKGPILGNATDKGAKQDGAPVAPRNPAPPPQDDSGDVPF